MIINNNEVLSLLRALTPLVQGCTNQLSSEVVCNALLGLRSMSSDHDEVRSLLRALTPLVQGCKEPLSAGGVNALIGLEGMRSDNK